MDFIDVLFESAILMSSSGVETEQMIERISRSVLLLSMFFSILLVLALWAIAHRDLPDEITLDDKEAVVLANEADKQNTRYQYNPGLIPDKSRNPFSTTLGYDIARKMRRRGYLEYVDTYRTHRGTKHTGVITVTKSKKFSKKGLLQNN